MNYRKVPFFNYPAVFKNRKEEYLATMTDVMERGAFIMQKDLEEFEATLAKYCGTKYAFGVADGTAAIVLALKATGIGEGDEVILPSHTFIATASSVHFVGAKPILADCGADHMLDPKSVEKRITGRTRAILPVQLNGRTCNMTALQQLADKHGLTIVEDAAQALGSKFKGKCAGTFGKAGTISFYPAKTLGAFGDAGAVLTDDDKAANLVRSLRDHGRGDDGEIVMWGYNSRLDNLQAAVLNLKMKYYESDLARRREIALRYQTNLGALKQLHLPPAPGLEPDHYDIFQNYEIEADNRDLLRNYLGEAGIGTIIQWGGRAVHHMTKLGLDGRDLPYTDEMFKRCFLLPMHPFLSNEDVDFVSQTIRDFYNR